MRHALRTASLRCGRWEAAGRPAAGIAVRLESRDGDVLDSGVTDGDGRIGSLGGELALGWQGLLRELRADDQQVEEAKPHQRKCKGVEGNGLVEIVREKMADRGERRVPSAFPSRIDAKTEKHATSDSPLADYGVKDVEDARLSGGLAGVIGVGVTVVAGSTVFWVVRRRRTADTTPVGTGV